MHMLHHMWKRRVLPPLNFVCTRARVCLAILHAHYHSSIWHWIYECDGDWPQSNQLTQSICSRLSAWTSTWTEIERPRIVIAFSPHEIDRGKILFCFLCLGLMISGAISLAINEVNSNGTLKDMGHSLDFKVAETYGEEVSSIRQTAALWTDKVYAYIGPQETCVHEGRMAAAFNLPMISYVSCVALLWLNPLAIIREVPVQAQTKSVQKRLHL